MGRALSPGLELEPDRALLDAVRRIGEAAASRILEVYRTPFEVARKSDQSPLTEADLAAHRTIVEGLHALAPSIPVLSEESADEVDHATRAGWARYWLVDPLDGTKDFVNRNGEFTVNIALIERHAPALGVVVVPVSGVAYTAGRGVGAWRHDAAGTTALRVHAPVARPWRVAASRSHADPRTEAFIRNLGPSERVSIGSSLKFCLVAEGEIDIYARFGPTCEWDTAAAQCVLEQAGGRVTDIDLAPLRYNTGASLLNPYFLAFGDPGVDWRRFMPDEAARPGRETQNP